MPLGNIRRAHLRSHEAELQGKGLWPRPTDVVSAVLTRRPDVNGKVGRPGNPDRAALRRGLSGASGSCLIAHSGGSFGWLRWGTRAVATRPHRDHTGTAFSGVYSRDDHVAMRVSARLRPIEDYTNKYKGEQVEIALFGGEYQDGVLTAYCYVEDVAHIELNGHILIPLQNIASLHCSSRCDAPEPDWPPHGLAEDDADERDDEA
jgi:hypothetical protein